ncbi:Battenin [Plasmodiophora brassicae]
MVVMSRKKHSSVVAVHPDDLERQPPVMKPVASSQYRLTWVAFFLLGLSNSIVINVVTSSASEITTRFNIKKWIGIVSLAQGIASIIVQGLNVFLERVPPRVSAMVTLVGFIIGTGLMIIWSETSVIAVMLGIFVIGSAAAFGEISMLCSLRAFPVSMVGAWSSGSGGAGLAGSMLFLLLLRVLKLRLPVVFALMTPFLVMFGLAFTLADRNKKSFSTRSQSTSSSSSSGIEPVSCHKWSRSLALVYSHMVNIFLQNFMSYLMTALMAHTSGTMWKKGAGVGPLQNWMESSAFELLNVSFQIGAFLARSSRPLFAIHRFTILSVLQAINFALYITHLHHRVMPLPAEMLLMLWMGALNGAAYVNIFYDISKEAHNPIPIADRHFCIVIVGTCSSVAVVVQAAVQMAAPAIFPIFNHLD